MDELTRVMPSILPLLLDNNAYITEDVFDVTSPTTQEVLYQCSNASIKDAVAAANSTEKAFTIWKMMPALKKRDILFKAAEIMDERKEELISYEMAETGAEYIYSQMCLARAIEYTKDFAARLTAIEGIVPATLEQGNGAMIVKEPYGGILSVAPWNAPYVLGNRAIIIPLAAGNTVVLKGSEMSPKCFWALVDVYHQAGIPKGVLNLIYSSQSNAPGVTEALIAHPFIRKINFTGSTLVGSKIASLAGKYVKPVLLELGGKASALVLDDANLEIAAKNCLLGAFMHGGQVCMSTERILVQRSILGNFRKVLQETAESMFGNKSQLPTLICRAAVLKNGNLIQDAVSKGASIIFQQPLTAHKLPNQNLQCVILESVTEDMDLYSQESFGPSVSLFVFDEDNEAISAANDTDYGLTASIFTSSLGRGLNIANRLQTGAVHINMMTIGDEPIHPHGGWKSSGFGRFGGTNGYDAFLQTKTITWK